MRGLVGLGLTALVACGSPQVDARVPTSTEQWKVARTVLGETRAQLPQKPYAERVRMVMKDPRTGREISARGGLAVDPEKAARMLLVGPGGVTALDVWVTRDKFRFVVPAIHYERRGGRDPEEMKGLPVGLLRWWFLSPLSGRLLDAIVDETGVTWLLKQDGAAVYVTKRGEKFGATRYEHGRKELIQWAGMSGRYVDESVGLVVDVEIEERMTEAPDPEAFADPDQEGT